MQASPTRTPDGYKRPSTSPIYQQVTDVDSPVDTSAERGDVVIQADSSGGQVDITMPSAERFLGTYTVQHPSAANNVVLTAQAGETFDNNNPTETLNAVGISTYVAVRYAAGGFGWAQIA